MSWRFNPPPGWPVPPGDWTPPPGWEPDPAWPPAPPGWEFWVTTDAPGAPDSTPSAPAATEGALPPVDPWPTPRPFEIQGSEAGPTPGPMPPPPEPPDFGQPSPVPFGTPPPSPPGPFSGPPPGGPPPGGPYQPYPQPGAPRQSRARLWAGGAAIAAVILVVCSGGIVFVANWDQIVSGGDDDDPTPPPTPAPAEMAGWEDCSDSPNECNSGAVQQGGTLVWGAQPRADGWNINTSLGGGVALAQIMSGVLPTTGYFLPDRTWQWNLDLLAEEPAQVGEDPHTYQYRIRPEAKWSDGTDITADDFIFHWRHNSGDAEHCDSCSPAFVRGYNRIESVEGSDGGKTVTVTFASDQADPEWFVLFTGLYPAHVAEAAGSDLETPDGMAEASEWFHDTVPDWSGGPWQVAPGADPYSEVVLEPNDQWYGQTHPALDQIVFRMIADPVAMQQALQSGQIDGFGPRIDPGPEDEITALDVLSRVESSYVWDHVDFNLEGEWTGDAALRQAIFTAIDLEQVINLAYGMPAPDTERRLNHLFPPGSPYYEDHLTGTGQGSGDLTAALAILDDAGYELDDGVLTSDGDQVGPLVLEFSEGQQRRQATAEVVASQLDALGIEVTLRPGVLSDILLDGPDYDLVLFGWSSLPTFIEDGRQYWHRDSGSNFGSYANDEVDALVDEATYASSLDEAAALLNQAMGILVDDAYVLPIAATPELIAVRDQFRNIRPNPADPRAVFANSHEWGITTTG